MREIKFRFTFKNGEFIAQRFRTLDELLGCSFAQEEMEEDIWCSTDFEDEPQLELIAKDESTGLSDNNGIDIYEGDIVRYGSDFKTVITFLIGSYMVNYATLNEAMEDYELEVIGNIYQTPELLKEISK